jgi:hypothetical protein
VTFNWLPPIDYNYNSTISKYKITTTSDVLVAFVQVPRFRDVEGESYTLYETNGGNYRLSAINSLDVEGPSVTLPEPVTVTTTDATTSAISALVTNIVYTSTDNVSFIKKETTAETLEADLGASINTLYANNVKKQFIEYTVNDVQTTISATAIKVSDAALSVDTTNDTTIAFN